MKPDVTHSLQRDQPESRHDGQRAILGILEAQQVVDGRGRFAWLMCRVPVAVHALDDVTAAPLAPIVAGKNAIG